MDGWMDGVCVCVCACARAWVRLRVFLCVLGLSMFIGSSVYVWLARSDTILHKINVNKKGADQSARMCRCGLHLCCSQPMPL